MYALFPKLAERRRQLAGSMSGGEQQMCAMARALMAAPVLMMVDEMSLGLAPVVVEQLMEVLAEIRQRRRHRAAGGAGRQSAFRCRSRLRHGNRRDLHAGRGQGA